MQGNIANGLHFVDFGDQKLKTPNVYSTCDKEVQNRHYCSPGYELSLHYQIQHKPVDKSNNYYSDHETNDASSQTESNSLDFFAAPAQLTTTDLSVRGRLEVWVQKSQNDSATRIEFVPYSSNSEANILQASRQPTRETHIVSPNTIHRRRKSRRILQIPKTTTVQNILRFHQNKIPDRLKESHESSVTLESSSSRKIPPTSSVSNTWLNEESNSNAPRKQLGLRRYRFQQPTNDRKQIQRKLDMIETRTKTDNGQKALPYGEHQEKREYKMILIKNLWRAKYMSDVDIDDADWKSKINPMHIVIDELDTNKIEEFKRKIEGRFENDNRFRRRMAGIRIVVLGPFRSRAIRTRQ